MTWYVELLKVDPVVVRTQIIYEEDDALMRKLSGKVIIPWRLLEEVREFTSEMQGRRVLYPFMFDTNDKSTITWIGLGIIIPFKHECIIKVCSDVIKTGEYENYKPYIS